MRQIRRLTAALAVVAVTCVSISLFACAAPQADGPDADYSARVDALLPTAEPFAPASSQSGAALPPTESPASQASVPEPTHTSRPLPTYTPRPTPIPANERERAQGVTFQAESLDGSVLTLSDTYGTPTLLAFWAPW